MAKPVPRQTKPKNRFPQQARHHSRADSFDKISDKFWDDNVTKGGGKIKSCIVEL